ncbi:MAG: hypothetical protein WA188_14890 [Terriglobales bacterium]
MIAAELLKVLERWKQATPFPASQDWVFASPLKLGRLRIMQREHIAVCPLLEKFSIVGSNSRC